MLLNVCVSKDNAPVVSAEWKGGGVVQEEDEGMMMGWPLLQGDPEPPPPHLALLHTLFA